MFGVLLLSFVSCFITIFFHLCSHSYVPKLTTMTRNLWLFLFFSLLYLSSCRKDSAPPFTGVVTTVGTGDDEIKVAVVRGTPYEMGKQLGTLLADDVRETTENFLEAFRKEYGEQANVDIFLDAAWKENAPYIDSRVLDEMQGLADGSGVPLEDLRRMHMVPVVSPYACSGVAMWGDATLDGHTYQLRNLDYTMDAGLQDHPLIVVYLPDKGTAHFNITFAGYIASNTGMNADHIVLGEKGRSPSSEFPYDIKGIHFSFLFRSLMYDAATLDDVLHTIDTASLLKKRYCLYFSDGNGDGIGAKVYVDGPDDGKITVWHDNDSADPMAPDIFPGVIYYTMKDEDAADYIRTLYGKFDAGNMISLSRLVAGMGGNLMDVVYDATTLEIWVAYANGNQDAALQKYVHVDLKKYLNY